jgi:F-type H+-transporting ATPase subunit b
MINMRSDCFVARILAALAAGMALSLSALPLVASEAGGQEAGALQKNILEMSVKIINFAILVFVLFKFLSKPLATYLSARAEAIRGGLEDLRQRRKAEEDSLAVYRRRLESVEEEIVKVKEAAKLEMDKERDQVLAEAHHAAKEIVRHAQESVKREFTKAKADLFNEATRLSLELAESMIRKNISDNDQRRLADEYIERIGRES